MGSGRKRKRRDLGRVAEIVMVLAAGGEARGGRTPTAAERALVAEARGRLAAAVVVAVRPRELCPREAVCALVEDLGLARPRDPARPLRASIAHRILLTARKMEQFKESPLCPATSVPQSTKSSATSVFQHGASKSAAASSFPASTLTRVTTPSSASKLSRPNETPAGVPLAKSTSLTSSIISLSPAGSANVEVEKGVNYPSSTQSGATIGQAKTSAHFNATRSSQSTVWSSSGGKSEEKKAPSIQPLTGNTVIGHQVPPGAALVQQKPCFSNHDAIAKNVQRVLHQPANHPTWTLPSTEYMHAGLDCQSCKTFITDIESLLVCDACERGVHLMCLQHYGNEDPPNAEWYCPTCVACSKGKPMPPKYGKVTRTIVAPKASLTNGVTLKRASANPCTKDNIEEVAGDGQKSAEAGSSARNSDSLALNTSSKSQLVSASEHQKENIKHTETLSKQKEGHGPPSRGPVTETVESSSEIESSGASTYSGAGNLLEQSHMQSETSESPRCAVISVNDSMPQYTEISEGGNTNHSFIDPSEECGIERNSEQLLNKDVQTARSSITPADETYQEDVAANIGIGYPMDDEIS